MKKKIKIGFTFNLNQNSGPSIFLKRLKDNIAENKLSYVSNIFNPFNDILIFSNKVRIGQLNQTIDGINYSARLAGKVLENATFVSPTTVQELK